MKQQMKDTNICSKDIIRTFISRRGCFLLSAAPTRYLPTSMPELGSLRPLSSTNPPTQEAKDRFPGIESDRRGRCWKRGLDKFDPDPVIFWRDLKMGRTPPRASASLRRKPPMFPQPTSNHRSMSTSPLQAEAGQEFVDKPMAQQENKTPNFRCRLKPTSSPLSASDRTLAGKVAEAPQGRGTSDLTEHGDARKALFEELLWEHRNLARGAQQVPTIPEASIEALKAQVAALQGRLEEATKALKTAEGKAAKAHKATAEEATKAVKAAEAWSHG
ncbi:hypothetical protein QYE76_017874 [Lolium multiflorum]|uniref:Uncharacterized protein n=1 Tax=Lolium multiflorum TaxID=4521 RepID=A0AAD8QE61_LOLMU|nr:hypothetical protein QYE76_017874 [Lolium multiflorum]